MIKTVCAGALALAMMTGVAFAQGMSSDSTTSTNSTSSTSTTVAPTMGSYSSSKTVDGNGVVTDKNQTYSSGVNGSKSTSTTRTTEPDGSQTSTQRSERTVSPAGDSTTSNRTTTTTVTH